MFFKIKWKIILDALLIILVGAAVGFAYNYVRKDGLQVMKKWPHPGEQDSTAVESSGTETQDPAAEPVFIDLDEAKKLFENGEAVFLDAREKEEYLEGHIEGSINVPYGWYLDKHPDISGMFDQGRVIVTYCSGTECEASIQLAFAMRERGFKRIKIFYGGWQEWVNAGFPVKSGA
ncbi:MAG: rhodanese-like domain-containing protein [Acidobacteriota bacterium]